MAPKRSAPAEQALVIAPPSPLTVSVTAVTPAVAIPKAPITVTGKVRNSGGLPIAPALVRAQIGQRPLTSRQEVAEWATPTAEQSLTEVAHKPLGGALAPGAVAAFTITVPASAISHGAPFGVLPLRVEVVGKTLDGRPRSGDVHTFLPALATIKAFEPVSVAWLVPLTLDPDPALHGASSPARSAAWTKAIGPRSRLARLIQGTDQANVTWAIDPAILGPRQTLPATSAAPAATTPPSTSPPAPPGATVTPDPVTVMTGALAKRLKAAAPRHTLWSLPYADPDLSALLPLATGNRDLTALISHPSTLDVAVGPARTDIAWPVGEAITSQTEGQLQRAFASPGLTAAVTSTTALASQNGSAADASRKSSTGLPLLAYDEPLSRTVAETSSKGAGAVTIQRFLADSMALLAERPGTRGRSVLIAEPRTFAGDPTVLRSLFAAIAKAPWLIPTTTDRILSGSQKLLPEVPGTLTASPDGTPPSPTSPTSPISPTASPTTSPPAGPGAGDPLSPGLSPLTSRAVAKIPGTLTAIEGVASILADGRVFANTWTDTQAQLLSTRWRNQPRGLAALDAATQSAIRAAIGSVRVAPSSVNFFADRGVLQVTVVNDLAVPIHDVRLTLTPAQPRLRIEQQPEPLKIGARSRANARVQVTSVAAGLVSVKAVLNTPNGTPLGQNAAVNVRVQPPSTWIYWVLGALAGVILVLGTQRSLRRGSTRASRPDPQEPPLHD